MTGIPAGVESPRPSPFPGPAPFQYQHSPVFFERDEEACNLLQLIAAYRCVLLYADSGVGKSSLVNAGLMPRAVKEGYRPYIVKVQPKLKEEFLLTCVRARSDAPLETEQPEGDDRNILPAEQLSEWTRRTRAQAEDATIPLLILDQFEEVVTLFEDGQADRRRAMTAAKKAQIRVFDALVSLINDSTLRVKLLLSFREDFLAKLTPFLERCPGLSDQRLRLEPLKATQVNRLVRGPFDTFPGKYVPEIPPNIAQKIEDQFAARSADGQINLTELQIVCETLYNGSADKAQVIRAFEDFDGVGGILKSYFYSSVEALGPEHTGPAIALLGPLVTGAGTRNVVSRDDLLARVAEDGYDEITLLRTLETLERIQLIRRELRRNVYLYEIVSEFLIDPIKEEAHEYIARQKELPFGHFVDLITGDVHPLFGDHALVGRGIPDDSHRAINFSTRFVSRVHLLVLRSRHVFDARSTNGTTLNASALNPEDLCKMEDGDIVVIANLKVLRFQAGANPKPDLLTVGVIDEASRGLFISGTTRSVTVLAPAEYYVTLDPETGLRLGLESATGCVARLAVPHEGNLTLEILREDVEFLAYLKRREGNFGWEGWSVRPGKPFDPSGAHFSCNGLPLQIVDLPTPSGDDEQKLVKSEEDDGEDLTTPDEDDGEKEDPTRGNSGLPH